MTIGQQSLALPDGVQKGILSGLNIISKTFIVLKIRPVKLENR